MLSHQQANLKAGEYLIPAHASMRDIMDAMVTGKGILYSVSIPEGLTSQQIVDRLNSEDILVGNIAAVPPEGALLPETYKFTRGDIHATFARASPSGLWIATDVSVDTLVGPAHLRLTGLSIQGGRTALAAPVAPAPAAVRPATRGAHHAGDGRQKTESGSPRAA